MRLLLCIPYFAPAYAYGGSVTVAETITSSLAAMGHSVTVATTDVLDEHERIDVASEERDGVHIRRFRNLSHRAAYGSLYLPRGYAAWLKTHVGEFDVVLLQDFYSAVCVRAARAADRAGVPYVLQPLGTLSPAKDRGRSQAKQLLMRVWGRRTIEHAAGLIHSSGFERSDMLAAGARPEQLIDLPLPLDLPRLDAGPTAPSPSQTTVISVGRLHPIKRLDVAVEATVRAASSVPGLRLDVVGSGPRVEGELRRQVDGLGAAERVSLHGFVPQEEKLRLLTYAQIGILLSASEGLPMAVLEYLACGLPVVLSEGCHLPEVDEVAGLVVGGDAASAADAIVRLATDRALWERLSGEALRFADRYRTETVMPRMAATLEDVASGEPR